MERAMQRSALLQQGFLRTEIDRSLRERRWSRLHNGIYLDAKLSAEQAWLAQLHGHLLRGGAEAAVSHRSAALLHAFEGIEGRPIDITVPFTSTFRAAPAIRSRTLHCSDVTAVDGLAVTNQVRTLLELGRFESIDTVEVALESALRGPDPRRPDVWNTDLLASLALGAATVRIRGAAVLRKALARRPPNGRPTGSIAETRAIQTLRKVGITDVLRQPTVAVIGIRALDTYYPDLMLPGLGVLIEIDGAVDHTSDADRRRDSSRQNKLAIGFHLLRFPASVALFEPEGLARDVTAYIDGLPTRGDTWTAGTRQIERTAEGWRVSTFATAA